MEDPPRDKQVTEYMTADAAPLVADDAAGRRRGRPEHLAFPLMGKVQEIELGGLSKGWYLVCGEAVRTDDNVVLERDCLWARIFAQVQEEGRSKDFGEYPTHQGCPTGNLHRKLEYSLAPLKQHIKCFNFRFKIQLDFPVKLKQNCYDH